MTDAQDHGRVALVNGWISNGGTSDVAGPTRECVFRLPGTPAYANGDSPSPQSMTPFSA